MSQRCHLYGGGWPSVEPSDGSFVPIMRKTSFPLLAAMALSSCVWLACGRVTNGHTSHSPEKPGDGGGSGVGGSLPDNADNAGSSPDTGPDAGAGCPTDVPPAGTACNERGRVCADWGSCGPSCTCGPTGWLCQTPNCQPGCDYDDPNRKYFGKGSCDSIDYSCPSGQASFQDRCGCGCLLSDAGL